MTDKEKLEEVTLTDLHQIFVDETNILISLSIDRALRKIIKLYSDNYIPRGEGKKKQIKVYTDAINVARDWKQTTGINNDYYITLTQLEGLIKLNSL